MDSVDYIVVDGEHAGQRIDNFLLSRLKGVPRTYVYRILRKGEVRVNKGRIKPHYRLNAGDRVRIPPVRVAERRPLPKAAEHFQWLEDRVLFEDASLLIVDKPSGLAVHGGSGLSYGLIEALRALRPTTASLELAHRLDRETSGCLVVCKRRSKLRQVHALLRDKAVDKRYLALLDGRWQRDRVQVEAPLRKNLLRGGERVVSVAADGKEAVTEFRRVRQYPTATLVEARLWTGRTHQIRVHAAHLGTPVLGDDKYGHLESNQRLRALGLRRLFLHAHALKFRLPGYEHPVRVRSELPGELEEVLKKLDLT